MTKKGMLAGWSGSQKVKEAVEKKKRDTDGHADRQVDRQKGSSGQ